MSAQDDLFAQLDIIYEKRGALPLDLTNTAFMVTRWLSMNAGAFWPAQTSNLYAWRLPPWAIGALLYYMVPQTRKTPRVKYVKKPEGSDPTSKFDKEILQRVSRHFKCGLKHAVQTCELLKAQGINLKEVFGIQR